jgi:hypothetical protein
MKGTHHWLRWQIVMTWAITVKVFIYRKQELGQPRQRGWPAPCVTAPRNVANARALYLPSYAQTCDRVLTHTIV